MKANLEDPALSRLGSGLYRLLRQLGAESDLLAIVGSLGDTLSVSEIAELIEDYLQTGSYIHEQH